MIKFKDFTVDSFSTHAAERAIQRDWTKEEIEAFTNPIITKTIQDRLEHSTTEEPDYVGWTFFIFKVINHIPRAAIGVYKKGFKKGEGIKLLIITFLDKRYRESDYYFSDVCWTIKILSDTEITIYPEELDNPPKSLNSKSVKKQLIKK